MIIDIHTHLFAAGWVPKEFYYGIARFITREFAKQGVHQTNEEVGDALVEATSDPDGVLLLEEMDEAGIDKSVVFPIDFGVPAGDPEVPIETVNRHIADVAAKHPDRLISFVSVDPRREGALDLVKKCVEDWGMQGLKLHPSAGFYPNQEEVYRLLEWADSAGLPVIIHSGGMMYPWRAKFSQAMFFDDIAVDFPDLQVIAAHAGGMFGYQQMIAVASIKLNILVDISAWQVYAQKDYAGFCRALRQYLDFVGSDRVLFGSDSPSFRSIMSNTDWVGLIRDLPKNAPEGTVFSREEISAILGGNALRLLTAK